ncbi:hypothetical protein NE237_012847 [Protea cynaroides]|uniref:Uncharacterized protein n=1 Tax=Protea cynaroides TaxID=273540 RepID=A0A9Q0H2P0_9MAGN|nr:hypothetical protein NE237_012847 [Protea cynaroides]
MPFTCSPADCQISLRPSGWPKQSTRGFEVVHPNCGSTPITAGSSHELAINGFISPAASRDGLSLCSGDPVPLAMLPAPGQSDTNDEFSCEESWYARSKDMTGHSFSSDEESQELEWLSRKGSIG